jgi:putative oxidoreductase
MELALLVLRVVVGLLFVGHGMQKLVGWFGGHGLRGTGQFFESLGMKPGVAMAVMAGGAEAVGGLLFALGLVVPLAAAMLIAVMLVAVWTAHRRNGLWASDGGYEYNLVLIAVAFAVAGIGAGDWSLDSAFGLDLSGVGWALGSLGAGVLGSIVAVMFGRYAARGSVDGAAPAAPAGA